MEKLIELLNEWYQERYDTKTRFDKFENYGGNDYWYFKSNDNGHFMYEADVWTKKYWFIKRLVEKDKIDYHNVLRMWYEIEDWVFYHYDDYYSLLMTLSIQDNPIEFLVSILK